MGSNLDLHGIYVPLITPFAADGSVALEDLKRLANDSLDDGAAGLLALGTTGEPATLTPLEAKTVVQVVGDVCREREAPFIVGGGSNNTAATVAAAKSANEIEGLTAILSVVPYYTRPTEDGIVQHFKAVAEASAVPVILYNIPYRTGRGLGAASLFELSRTPNIAGLKQAVGGIDQDTLNLMATLPDDFHVLGGDDPFIYPLLALGGKGAIAASSHVCTAAFVQMVDAALKQDFTTARELSEILLPVCQALFAEPGPMVIKSALHALGRISTPSMRLPMTNASQAATASALSAINLAEAALDARA